MAEASGEAPGAAAPASPQRTAPRLELTSRTGRWIASIWLVYLGFVFYEPFEASAPLWLWAVSVLSVLVFLPLYYGSFHYAGPRPRRALAMVVAIAVLGLALVPINVGGCTYVIFSAAIAGFPIRRRVVTLLYVAGLALGLAGMFVLRPGPFQDWMGFQVVLVAIVGLANALTFMEKRSQALVRRAQEEVEEMAKLAERERIARDLHDVLGHTLSVIALKSELAAKLADLDPRRAVAEIRDVERVSRLALTEVRAAVEGYRQRGFRGEVQHGTQALGAAGVRLETEISPLTLAAKQETVLALAVREAITNVIRHARATWCRISLRADANRLVLRVEDDGVGGRLLEGNGLTGMRERVQAAGGTLTLEGARGVSLTVTVPR